LCFWGNFKKSMLSTESTDGLSWPLLGNFHKTGHEGILAVPLDATKEKEIPR
jgi:hypothetical protein